MLLYWRTVPNWPLLRQICMPFGCLPTFCLKLFSYFVWVSSVSCLSFLSHSVILYGPSRHLHWMWGDTGLTVLGQWFSSSFKSQTPHQLSKPQRYWWCGLRGSWNPHHQPMWAPIWDSSWESDSHTLSFVSLPNGIIATESRQSREIARLWNSQFHSAMIFSVIFSQYVSNFLQISLFGLSQARLWRVWAWQCSSIKSWEQYPPWIEHLICADIYRYFIDSSSQCSEY